MKTHTHSFIVGKREAGHAGISILERGKVHTFGVCCSCGTITEKDHAAVLSVARHLAHEPAAVSATMDGGLEVHMVSKLR